MSFVEISKVVAVPKKPSEAPMSTDWANLEHDLATALPQDFKEMIEAYGTGSIDDFLWVANPFSRQLSWKHRNEAALAALRKMRDAHGAKEVPFALHPELGGLLLFGWTDNGNDLFWKTDGDPERWTVVVTEARGPGVDVFDGSATTFLAQVLEQKHRCPLFPDSFPKKKHKFTVYLKQRKIGVRFAPMTDPFDVRLGKLREQAGKTSVTNKQTSPNMVTFDIKGTGSSAVYREYDPRFDTDPEEQGSELSLYFPQPLEETTRKTFGELIRREGWTVTKIWDWETRQPTWPEGV